MLRNYRVWLAAAVVFAVLAAVSAVTVVRSFAGAERVVVAGRDLTPGSLVQASDLSAADVPRGALYPDAVRVPSEVAGMAVKG
ncbi:SAF domain-containing protein, partial [Ammonifex thiophilus]